MTKITVEMKLESSIAQAWSRLVDWESHSTWIPSTKVRLTNSITGVGATFTGTTRIGPFVLDDPMTVTKFSAPKNGRAECLVTKDGPVLSGTAGFTLKSLDKNTTKLEWFEEIQLRPKAVFWWTEPLVYLIGRAAFTAALKKFANFLGS
jgi:carbon monoxide dehydrogenase subunit G